MQHMKTNNSGINDTTLPHKKGLPIESEVWAFTLIQGIFLMCNENYYIVVQKINENVNS